MGHQSWQSGLAFEWLGGSLPTAIGTFGFDLSAVHAGSLPAYDASGLSVGSFRPMELVAGAGWGHSVNDALRVGVGGRWMRLQGADEAALTAFGFDLGLEIEILGGVVGGGIRNWGPDAVGPSGRYPIAAETVLGVSRRVGQRLQVDLHGVLRGGGESAVFGGAQIDAPGGLSLRAGAAYRAVDSDTPVRPRAGLAFRLSGVDLSYAFGPDESTGDSHHFSLTLPIPVR